MINELQTILDFSDYAFKHLNLNQKLIDDILNQSNYHINLDKKNFNETLDYPIYLNVGEKIKADYFGMCKVVDKYFDRGTGWYIYILEPFTHK